MEWPVYDLVIGNVPGASAADDPDKDWEPDDMVAGAVVTRQQAKVKKLSPLKVAKSPDLKMDTAKVRRLQLTDPTLERIRGWLDEGKGENPWKSCTEKYYWSDKTQLLMPDYTNLETKGKKVITQLVLPSKLHDAAMEVAHDSILGGHLGTAKTQDRVLSNFYWPRIHDDVTMQVLSVR